MTIATTTPAHAATLTFLAKGTRGMWVWNTLDIMTDAVQFNIFVNEAQRSGATQVFLYLTARQIVQYRSHLRVLIRELRSVGIAAYAMDGWRGYFSDADGPAALYSTVTAMLNYNAAVVNNEDFVGFMADLEPQDGQGVGLNLFHNNIKQSALSASQLVDRNRLISDWLEIYNTLQAMVRRVNLRLAGSMPSWTDNYFGEPVLATWQGSTKDVTHFLMPLIDDYCIMSYNTNPNNIANRIASKLTYADTLARPPRIFGGVETHTGVGVNVSYGDTPPKNTKAAVVADLTTVFGILNNHPTFAGMNIHDWLGWQNLAPIAKDSSAPHAPTHRGTPAVCGWWA